MVLVDFHKLTARYKQFGGTKLVIVYTRLGVLWPVVKLFFRCLSKRQSFKRIYPEVLKRVEPFLIGKYEPVLKERKAYYRTKGLDHHRGRIVWFCWLQSLENAPEIVIACYKSLRYHLKDREIMVVNNENWREYIELPDYIANKWEKGRIPAAMFSDLLRLELLIKYGGTWIDSTVLCTGLNDNHNENEKLSRISEFENNAKQYLDADLFLFQYTEKGSIPVSISNWFITACSNNEVLMVLRDMLYAYWKDYDCTLDYYIFHLFFSLLSKEYPEELLSMPYAQSTNSLVLLHHWGEKFSQKKWDKLTSQVSFHKLAFRVKDNIKNDKENYFNHILNTYESRKV